MDSTLLCDDGRLRILLDNDQHHHAFASAAEHLEFCECCQQRLVQLAAQQDEWAEAKRALMLGDEDDLDREQLRRTWSLTDQRRPPESWTESMSRQLLDPPSHPEMLGRLGRYEIEKLIGAGGMGVVFKAFDSELNRPVAVKVLTPHLAGSGAARARFSREARAAAAIVHEHVVAIHNVQSEHEPPFLVMQYVAGESLQDRIDRVGPLGVCEILRIAHQTAAALSAAHEQGLVHRDVKPSNILLEIGVERTLLTDFGLARASDDASLTHTGHVPGTPHYMSPEQARGRTTDHRSDLFSMGSLMYAMCTGRPPFRAETSYGVLRRITDDQPTSIRDINPEIPQWLCGIIDRLMAKEAEDRPESAVEVAQLLEGCLAHVQNPTTTTLPKLATEARAAAPPARMGRRIAGATMGFLAAIILGIFALLATAPSDIAGTWKGDEWGTVELELTGKGRYVGSYGATVGDEPGEIQLKWSRREQRFNGTWSEGDDRFGKLSVRLIDTEIRGAWTTSNKAKIQPKNPELSDLLWKRIDHPHPNQRAQSKPTAPATKAENWPPVARADSVDTHAATEIPEAYLKSATVMVELDGPKGTRYLTIHEGKGIGSNLVIGVGQACAWETQPPGSAPIQTSIQIAETTESSWNWLRHFKIVARITDADIDQLRSGQVVTKVIYLPEPAADDESILRVKAETIVSTRLDPGIDPIAEAKRRGTVLATIRFDVDPIVLDVNRDGKVTAADALLVINDLNRLDLDVEAAQDESGQRRRSDVNGNGRIEGLDALLVINALSEQSLSTDRAEPEKRLRTRLLKTPDEVAAAVQHLLRERMSIRSGWTEYRQPLVNGPSEMRTVTIDPVKVNDPDPRKFGLVLWWVESLGPTHAFTDSLANRYGKTTEVSEGMHQGHAVTVVNCKPDTALFTDETTFWLSPRHGNHPVFIETRFIIRNVRHTRQLRITPELIDGIWYPRSLNLRELEDGKQTSDRVVWIKEAKFNRSAAVGTITDLSKNRAVTIDLGTNDQLKVDDILEVLDDGTPIGRIQVTSVSANTAQARIFRTTSSKGIIPGAVVRTDY